MGILATQTTRSTRFTSAKLRTKLWQTAWNVSSYFTEMKSDEKELFLTTNNCSEQLLVALFPVIHGDQVGFQWFAWQNRSSCPLDTFYYSVPSHLHPFVRRRFCPTHPCLSITSSARGEDISGSEARESLLCKRYYYLSFGCSLFRIEHLS